MYEYVYGSVHLKSNEIVDVIFDEFDRYELIDGYEWRKFKLIPHDYDLLEDYYAKEVLKRIIEEKFPIWYDEIINKDN